MLQYVARRATLACYASPLVLFQVANLGATSVARTVSWMIRSTNFRRPAAAAAAASPASDVTNASWARAGRRRSKLHVHSCADGCKLELATAVHCKWAGSSRRQLCLEARRFNCRLDCN